MRSTVLSYARMSRAMLSALVLGLLFVGAAAAAAIAADDEVTAVYTPQTLALLPGETQTAVLLLHNSGAAPITDVSAVNTPTSGRITTEVSDVANEVPAGGSVAIQVQVKVNGALPSQATVVTAIEFLSAGAKRTVVATLAVTEAAWPTAVPGPVAVTGPASVVALVQYQSVDILFTIENSSAGAQEISSVEVTAPAFLGITQVAPAQEEVGKSPTAVDGRLVVKGVDALAGGDSQVVHLRVSARNQLQPGNALVTLSVRYADSATRVPGFTSASSTMALSVFGESVLLQLLAVPALFVVPGLILVVVFWLLWTRVYPASRMASTTQGPLGIATSTLLWIFALTPSLLFPYFYQWVTGLLGAPRDYRVSYGFEDIVGLWLLASVVGALMWLAVNMMRSFFRYFFLILPGDEAIDVLRKLAFQIRSNRFTRPTERYRPPTVTGGPTVEGKDAAAPAAPAATGRPPDDAPAPRAAPASVEVNDQGARVYVLRYRRASTLVCPPITFSGGEAEVEKARALLGRPWSLYRYLRKRDNHMSVKYQASETIDRPIDVSNEQLSETGVDGIVRKVE